MFSPTLTPLLDHSPRQITFDLETWQKPGSNRFPRESVTVEVCINHLLTWAPSHPVCRLLMWLCLSFGQQPLPVVWMSGAVRKLATRDAPNRLSKLHDRLRKCQENKKWYELRQSSRFYFLYLSRLHSHRCSTSNIFPALVIQTQWKVHPECRPHLRRAKMHAGPLHPGISQRILSMDAIPITNLMKYA